MMKPTLVETPDRSYDPKALCLLLFLIAISNCYSQRQQIFEHRSQLPLSSEYFPAGQRSPDTLDKEFVRIDYFRFSNKSYPDSNLNHNTIMDNFDNGCLPRSRITRYKIDRTLDKMELLHAERSLKEIGLLDINIQPDNLRNRLSQLGSLASLRILNNLMSRKIIELKTRNQPYAERIEENYELLKQRYIHQINAQFIHYSYPEAANKLIKGVFVEHDNDFFAPDNLDRDYTGGGLIEIFTDYLKMRLLRGYLLNNYMSNSYLRKNNYYSYQSILFGAQAFTPYIRNTSKLPTDTSAIRTDRPFASFQFFGRGKYLIHRRGYHRIKETIKLGKIGGSDAPAIQRVLHRDLTSSVYPNGWGAQIGAPNGRYTAQFEVEHQLMILSKYHDIWSREEDCIAIKENRAPRPKQTALNIYLLANVKVGGQMTSGDLGIGWTNKNFIKQNFHHLLKYDRAEKLRWYNNILIDVNARYRYVEHNSMLEGFGYFNTKDYTNALDSTHFTSVYYRLSPGQMYRNLLLAEASISYDFYKTAIFYKINYISKEANVPDMRSPGYFYGTMGLIFSL